MLKSIKTFKVFSWIYYTELTFKNTESLSLMWKKNKIFNSSSSKWKKNKKNHSVRQRLFVNLLYYNDLKMYQSIYVTKNKKIKWLNKSNGK